ncbi:MAG: hypothetical protein V4490_05555 [Pseudomonadota bacterium]
MALWCIPLGAVFFWLLAGFYINHQINQCFIKFFSLTYIPQLATYQPEDPEFTSALKSLTMFNNTEGVEAVRDRIENAFAEQLGKHNGFKFLSKLSYYLDILNKSIHWKSITLRFYQARNLALSGQEIDPDLVPIFELEKGSPDQREAAERYLAKIEKIATKLAAHGKTDLLKRALKDNIFFQSNASPQKKEKDKQLEAKIVIRETALVNRNRITA